MMKPESVCCYNLVIYSQIMGVYYFNWYLKNCSVKVSSKVNSVRASSETLDLVFRNIFNTTLSDNIRNSLAETWVMTMLSLRER